MKVCKLGIYILGFIGITLSVLVEVVCASIVYTLQDLREGL